MSDRPRSTAPTFAPSPGGLARLAAIPLILAGGSVAAATTSAPGRADFVEYQTGELAVILTAPHGGRERPAGIADRKEGELRMDRDSQELAREIAAELKRRSGRAPHLIVSLLHRQKLDPNRDLAAAAQGDPGAERSWRRFHACVDQAKLDATTAHGFAFLVDVHGHSHPIERIELGYALSTPEINLTDAVLDADGAGHRSSLAHLHARGRQPISALIRGVHSLGGLLEARGYAVIPGPHSPQPLTDPYFSGSYILRHHASAKFPGVDGLQLECPYPGIRDTAANRSVFARAFVDALAIFLERHYHYRLLATGRSPQSSP